MKRYLLENKLLLFFTILLSIISSLAYVYIAVILQQIVDAAVSKDLSSFWQILLFSAIFFVVMCVLLYIDSLICKKLICKIIKSMRDKAFGGLVNHSMEDFNKQNTGDYLSAITNDVKLVEDNYLIPFLEMFQFAVIFIASLGLMVYYDIIITICVIFAISLMLIIPAVFGGIMQRRQEAYSEKLSSFTAHLKDLLQGFEVIKSYRMQNYVLGKFKKSNDETIDARYNVNKIEAANETLSMFLAVFVQVVVIFLAAYFIIIGRITAGMLLGMVQISANLSSPLIIIFQNLPKIKSMKPIFQRLNGFSDYQSEAFTGTVEPTFQTALSTKNLSFSYDKKTLVLKDITTEFVLGKKYALVGKSGCGKSTLVKLLTGYYSDYKGEIYYDDKSLELLDYNQMNELSTTIHQNVYMFDETIKDNICLHMDYDSNEVDHALKYSGVDSFLEKTPKGVDSEVGENGANLSGGQRQRIAVARAVIRKKPILILDEGTSAIDMQTAFDIENELLQINDLTLITITHNMREDVLDRYDAILFMEEGEILEVGNFRDLMSKQAAFYHFFQIKK